jgi:hypothetical protein
VLPLPATGAAVADLGWAATDRQSLPKAVHNSYFLNDDEAGAIDVPVQTFIAAAWTCEDIDEDKAVSICPSR